MGKLFEIFILKIFQRHTGGKNLLNASQFGFRTNHSTTLQCMRLTDNITPNFNNKMSIAAVCLDIEKAFDTLWHPGLLKKLKTPWSESASELYRPSDRRLSAK
jgi:hypothetical protein